MPLSCCRCQQGSHPPSLGCCCLLRMQPSGTGHEVSSKIRKKRSEACLKQLLQQMSQFRCSAESRFTEATLAELEWHWEGCVRLGAPRMPSETGVAQLPPWARSTGSAQHPMRVRGHLSHQRAGKLSCLLQSRCWGVSTAWAVATGEETESPPLLCFWIPWHTVTTVPWLGVQGCDSEGFWFAGE